jgi:hypothetical protein
MNKLIAFGVAVLLCVAAAGFGAYVAMRPRPESAVADPGTTPALAETAQARTPQATPVAAGQDVVPEPVAAPVQPRPAVGQPAAKAAPGPDRRAAARAGSRAVSGAVTAAPPASDVPAATAGTDRPAQAGSVADTTPPPAAPVPTTVPEPPAPPPPPQRRFEELIVAADAVLGLRVESTVSSEVARVEDPVDARVTRDVRVGSDIAIPSGTRVLGSVILVERGGKMKTAARIGVRFHTLVFADGSRLSIDSEAIHREGKSPGQESAAKVGGATVGGAILGAIIGGGKGAAIGSAVGAAGGTGAVMAGGRNPAVLNSGTSVTVRLRQPVTVTVERDELRN